MGLTPTGLCISHELVAGAGSYLKAIAAVSACQAEKNQSLTGFFYIKEKVFSPRLREKVGVPEKIPQAPCWSTAS